MISGDTEKKELVGEFKSLGKAVPYGIYDLTANAGWVNVGTDHDTATFAAESIRRWRKGAGAIAYQMARR